MLAAQKVVVEGLLKPNVGSEWSRGRVEKGLNEGRQNGKKMRWAGWDSACAPAAKAALRLDQCGLAPVIWLVQVQLDLLWLLGLTNGETSSQWKSLVGCRDFPTAQLHHHVRMQLGLDCKCATAKRRLISSWCDSRVSVKKGASTGPGGRLLQSLKIEMFRTRILPLKLTACDMMHLVRIVRTQPSSDRVCAQTSSVRFGNCFHIEKC